MNLLSILKLEDDPTQTEGAIATSPGILGWVFTFLLAAAVIFVIYDMVRRIRRVRYREEILEEISEEEAAEDEARELARERAEREKNS
jgi:large-conductance mechanosensitive channel